MSSEACRLRQGADDIRRAFNVFDSRGTGYVAVSELPLLLRALGVDATADDCTMNMSPLFGEQLTRVSLSDLRVLVEAMSMRADSEEEASYVFHLLCRPPSSSGTAAENSAAPSAAASGVPTMLLPAALSDFLRIGAPFVRCGGDPRFALDKVYAALDVDRDGVVSRNDWLDFLENNHLTTS